jgi:hypothetical protein
MDNRFLRCALEEKIASSVMGPARTDSINENRFLKCAMEHKTNAYDQYNSAYDNENRFTQVAREARDEYYQPNWYGPPRRQRQERQCRESVNDRARRMHLQRQPNSSSDKPDLQNLQEFPPLSPPPSPALKTAIATAPPSPVLKADWVEKVREAMLKNASSSSAEKANRRPPGLSLPVAFLAGPAAGSQNDTEEDIVFDEDGFPFLRMIESIDPSLTRR